MGFCHHPANTGKTLADLIFVGQNLISGGYMLDALWTTTLTVLYGFLIAIAIGFSLGVLVGETKFGERAVMPYLVGIDAMPKVAFAPLFIAWLGFDISSKVALAAFIATFPIVVATAAGLYAASENERMLFKSVGASRWQTLIRLKLPTGCPTSSRGSRSLRSASWPGLSRGNSSGGRGFGALIRQSASQFDTPRVFALILYLSLLGLAFYFTVVWLQRRLVFWNRSDRPGGIG